MNKIYIKRKKPCPLYISKLIRLADTKITAISVKLHEGFPNGEITGAFH